MQSIKNLVKYLKNKVKDLFFIAVLLSFFITACAVEEKIAKNKIQSSKFRAVIIGPEFIHKVSLKFENLTQEDYLKINNIDSLLFYQSKIIQYLEDSLFLSHCLISMQNELILNYKVKVYKSNSSYETLPDSTFILKFAEMEIEEFNYESRAPIEGEFGYYNERVTVDAINVNTWFELKYKTASNDIFPILYTSFYHFNDVMLHTDSMGVMIPLDSLIGNDSRIDSLQLENLKNTYKSAEELGKRYASYFYDYMLNVKLYDDMPEGKKPNYYLHYNYKTGRVYPIYEDMFIELEE